jgi:hypothetical protein
VAKPKVNNAFSRIESVAFNNALTCARVNGLEPFIMTPASDDFKKTIKPLKP